MNARPEQVYWANPQIAKRFLERYPCHRDPKFLLPEPKMKLAGKTALVTGAARGIGRGCALELAKAGADVAVNDRERNPQAEAVVAEIEALGRRSVLLDGDVFERASCEGVVARAQSALGRIDILVS